MDFVQSERSNFFHSTFLFFPLFFTHPEFSSIICFEIKSFRNDKTKLVLDYNFGFTHLSNFEKISQVLANKDQTINEDSTFHVGGFFLSSTFFKFTFVLNSNKYSETEEAVILLFEIYLFRLLIQQKNTY